MKPDPRVELLAARMWAEYVRANGGYRSQFARWSVMADDETKRGFRAVARLALRVVNVVRIKSER